MGVTADWEHPYKTMNHSFEAEEVKIFGEMYKKGYIYKGKKPVYWCYTDETALAEAEIEYQDDPLYRPSSSSPSRTTMASWVSTAICPSCPSSFGPPHLGPCPATVPSPSTQTWTTS